MITWYYKAEFIEAPHGKWCAYVNDEYVGTVWSDGTAIFGEDRSIREYGSCYLAAVAMAHYVEQGAR